MVIAQHSSHGPGRPNRAGRVENFAELVTKYREKLKADLKPIELEMLDELPRSSVVIAADELGITEGTLSKGATKLAQKLTRLVPELVGLERMVVIHTAAKIVADSTGDPIWPVPGPRKGRMK